MLSSHSDYRAGEKENSGEATSSSLRRNHHGSDKAEPPVLASGRAPGLSAFLQDGEVIQMESGGLAKCSMPSILCRKDGPRAGQAPTSQLESKACGAQKDFSKEGGEHR